VAEGTFFLQTLRLHRRFGKGAMWKPRISFNRNELAGAFGDIGTDLPLIVGIIQSTKMDPVGPLVGFGVAQLLTGLVYGIPMPVQPLKAMAVIVLAQKLPANVLWGGGLAIAIVMLILSASGILDWLCRLIPRSAIRGVQFGLGLQLASLALKDYIPREGPLGWLLAFVGAGIVILLIGNRRLPAALVVVALGLVWTVFQGKVPFSSIIQGIEFRLPTLHTVSWEDLWTGFLLLSLPQLPLSMSNSLFATTAVANDLFPERRITVRKLGVTYSLMNFVQPLLGGIPTCHGCGGMAGHCFFGARTGGSVVIYGSIWLVVGLFFSKAFSDLVQVFPTSILGVILVFEAITLMRFIKDVAPNREELFIALSGGLLAALVPYGYVWAILIGIALHHLFRLLPRREW
jgi:MFS superfamily sulfate permease-like transporter